MRLKRVAVIAPRKQTDGRPEIDHAGEMRFPVGDLRVENRPQIGINAGEAVKAPHQPIQRGVIEAGLRAQLPGQYGAAIGRIDRIGRAVQDLPEQALLRPLAACLDSR
jgi:hypothetical protein